MIATQDTFNFKEREKDLAARQNADRIKQYIKGQGWVSVRELLKKLDLSRRDCRYAREASKQQIISGNSGYKLMCEATIEEIHRSANRREAQGRSLIADATAMRVAYHRYFPEVEIPQLQA